MGRVEQPEPNIRQRVCEHLQAVLLRVAGISIHDFNAFTNMLKQLLVGLLQRREISRAWAALNKNRNCWNLRGSQECSH